VKANGFNFTPGVFADLNGELNPKSKILVQHCSGVSRRDLCLFALWCSKRRKILVKNSSALILPTNHDKVTVLVTFHMEIRKYIFFKGISEGDISNYQQITAQQSRKKVLQEKGKLCIYVLKLGCPFKYGCINVLKGIQLHY